MGKFRDLLGEEFGRLTVVDRAENKNERTAWICQCICGNKKTVIAKELCNGKAQSCGCLGKERARRARMSRTDDLIGKKVGYLVVRGRLEQKSKNGAYYFECLCTGCDGLKRYTSAELRRSDIISCGCRSAFKDKMDVFQLKERLASIFPNGEVVLVESTFKGARLKCSFLDREFGQFEDTPSNLLHNKKRHPQCGFDRRGENKRTTIPGTKFNRLEVIEYLRGTGKVRCRCDCGTTCEAKLGDIKKNRVTSCGCQQRESSLRNISAYNEANGFDGIQEGEKYGRLICLNANFDDGKAEFRCDCGSNFVGYKAAVKSGHTKSCGCMHSIEMVRRMSDPRYRLKVARSCNKITDLQHWETGEIIPCQASYEVAVVSYLNAKQIPYRWQIPFTMPDGRTYTVDLYLPDRDIYVEIKGWFRGDAQERWSWFKSKYPNAELWDKLKLQELGILPRKETRGRTMEKPQLSVAKAATGPMPMQ